MLALLAAVEAASPLKEPASAKKVRMPTAGSRLEETPSSTARSRLPQSLFSVKERKTSSSSDDSDSTHRKLPSGKLQKVCSIEGCASFSVKRGVCNKHGGADKCASPGCGTNSKARGE